MPDMTGNSRLQAEPPLPFGEQVISGFRDISASSIEFVPGGETSWSSMGDIALLAGFVAVRLGEPKIHQNLMAAIITSPEDVLGVVNAYTESSFPGGHKANSLYYVSRMRSPEDGATRRAELLGALQLGQVLRIPKLIVESNPGRGYFSEGSISVQIMRGSHGRPHKEIVIGNGGRVNEGIVAITHAFPGSQTKIGHEENSSPWFGPRPRGSRPVGDIRLSPLANDKDMWSIPTDVVREMLAK